MTRSGSARIRARVCLARALPVCLVIAVAGLAQPVRAATFLTVSTCDDGHLRAAVAQANSDNADDMILFALQRDDQPHQHPGYHRGHVH
jgi:hypothetical protein